MTLDELLDAVKARHSLASERALSRFTGLSNNAIFQYRHHRAWPSDDNAVMLAELAGLDPTHVLIQLAIWRTEGSARLTWQRALTQLQKIASIVLVATVFSAATLDVAKSSEEQPVNCLTRKEGIFYIMQYMDMGRGVKQAPPRLASAALRPAPSGLR